MKRFIIIIAALLFLLAGCNNPADKPNGSVSDPAKSGQEEQGNSEPADKGFVFEANGVTIAMHDETEPILARLGEPVGYFEAESCALPGLEKIYAYGGFEIRTYELNGVDYVLSVIFLDDSVSTKEGVYLYADVDEVVKTYGDNYTEESNLYKYTKGQSELLFVIEDGKVASIEYAALIQE
jgi:uncharacterized lipoprotein NlpE involved in copper resistance